MWNLGNIVNSVSPLSSCESLHVPNTAFHFKLMKGKLNGSTLMYSLKKDLLVLQTSS